MSSATDEGPPETGTAEGAAVAWVRAVMDRGDMTAAWALTHPSLRLVLVQQWILGYEGDPTVGPTEDWDALAAKLAASPSRHPLWDRFARERLRRWWDFWPGFSAETWRVADMPEKMGIGLEVVTFVERGDGGGAGGGSAEGSGALARRLAVRRMPGGWMVTGLDGRRLFRPGWPPVPVGAPTAVRAGRASGPRQPAGTAPEAPAGVTFPGTAEAGAAQAPQRPGTAETGGRAPAAAGHESPEAPPAG